MSKPKKRERKTDYSLFVNPISPVLKEENFADGFETIELSTFSGLLYIIFIYIYINESEWFVGIFD